MTFNVLSNKAGSTGGQLIGGMRIVAGSGIFGVLLAGTMAVFIIAVAPFALAFILLIWTGEVLRYVFSLGHHKVSWTISKYMKIGWRQGLVTELSWYLGIAFWLLVFVVVKNI